MAKWQRTLNLVDVWEQARKREITPQQLAKVVADRLEALPKFGDEAIDWARDDVVENFRSLEEADEGGIDFNDFDFVLNDLYNWADTSLDGVFGGKKVCWVKTF